MENGNFMNLIIQTDRDELPWETAHNFQSYLPIKFHISYLSLGDA